MNPPLIESLNLPEPATMQPSPLTAATSNATNSCTMPLVSTENIRYNVNENGITLSVPREQTPEKQSSKNYYNFEEGYDTDNKIGPFGDAVEGEEDSDDDMEPMPEADAVVPILEEPIPAIEAPVNSDSPVISLMEKAIKNMLNSELRAELKKRGLSQNGNKAVLSNRLLSNLQKPIQQGDAIEKVPDTFAPTAKWRQLKHKDTPVAEPQ
jgi:hypothetical protein